MKKKVLTRSKEIMACRFCNKTVFDEDINYIFSNSGKHLTDFGHKIKKILNSNIRQLKMLPNICCEVCSKKVNDCFKLILEIEAANYVINQIYNKPIKIFQEKNISIYDNFKLENITLDCNQCDSKYSDMNDFINHYQNHIFNLDDKNDLVITNCHKVKRDSETKMYNKGSSSVRNKLNVVHLKYEDENVTEHSYHKPKLQSDGSTSVEDTSNKMRNERLKTYSKCRRSKRIELKSLSNTEHQCDEGLEPDNVSEKSNDYVKVECKIETNELLSEELNSEILESSRFDDDSVVLIVVEKKECDPTVEYESYKENKKSKFIECDYCKSVFRLKSTLRNHVIKEHLVSCKRDKYKLLICKFCKVGFPRRRYRSHFTSCRAEFMSEREILCDICGKSFDPATFKAHMYIHRELNKGEQTCTICHKIFKSIRSLRTHMVLHDESKKVVCEVCGIKTNPLTLWKHMKRHQIKSNKCQYCGKAFTFNYTLQTHLKIHENGVYPNRKTKGFAPGPIHTCTICNKEYSYVSMLNEHLKEDHNESSVTIRSSFPCDHCDKTFDDHFSLRNHLMLMHNVSLNDVINLKSMQLGSFHCNICETVLKSEHGLRQHMKIEHRLQNKQMPQLMRRNCEKCNRSFVNKPALTAHIKSVHLNIGNLTCDICKRTFKRYQGLSYHRLIHLGKKPFECEVCLRSFRQRTDVIRHLQRHVRDGEATLETASARNNSDSRKVKTSRIWLKDSSYCKPNS